MKTYRTCKICNEEISVESENNLQYLVRDKVLNLKCHFHYKKHGEQFLTTKGLIKSVVWFVIAWILAILMFPIWIATWPFWWIHENLQS